MGKNSFRSFCILLSLLVSITMMGQAQNPEGNSWRDGLRTKKLKDMNKAERVAYKAALEARARELGIFPSKRKGKKLSPEKLAKAKPMPKRIPGTSITYDTGTVVGAGGLPSQMVGNRFDSALNQAGTNCCFPVEVTGTVTMVTFNMLVASSSSVFVSIYSNISGTMANQVLSTGTSASTGINTLSLTSSNQYFNGPFLAGVWQFSSSSTVLGIDTNSTGGQGFHGISINDIAGTMLADLTISSQPANAIFRVQGNVATPVELLNFKVE